MAHPPDQPTQATLDLGDPSPTDPSVAPSLDRYRVGELLGRGGMGEVWLAEDTVLAREVALKVLRRRPGPLALQAFEHEARLVARLEHPGIVPVHDLGTLPSGQPYFAMKRVRGETLDVVFARVETARRVELLAQVAQTVAFAHDRSVVHRDLKPANVMVGAYGEVLVLDWGIAHATDADRVGVAGTPGYVAPEHLAGSPAGPQADVYGLGALLFEVLEGSALGQRDPEARDAVLAAQPPAAKGLVDLCRRALSHIPLDRPSAGAFAEGLDAWRHGTLRREQALTWVVDADSHRPAADTARAQARSLRHQADLALADVPRDAPDAARHVGWQALDAAEAAEQQAALHDATYVQRLHGALSIDPDCESAHDRLADHWRAVHRQAERTGDDATALAALPFLDLHDRRGAHAAYRRGVGQLTLVSEPQAQVALAREVASHRRRVPSDPQDIGQSPIVDRQLAIGSYRVVLTATGHHPLTVPVRIDRLQTWSTVDPDGLHVPLQLLPAEALGSDDRAVAAGWFESGTEVPSGHPLPRRWLWCDGFVMERHPVTNARYVAFVNALCAAGRPDEAADRVPKDSDARPVYATEAGRYVLGADSDGHVWRADMPVVRVTWHDAMAFAAWQAETTGKPWRLPWELEWAKAARGVDYRLYPWGSDHAEVTWARMLGSPGPEGPHSIDDYPVDTSPYGVRHLAGQASCWLLDGFPEGGRADASGRVLRGPVRPSATGYRHLRGGAWRQGASGCRSDARKAADEGSASDTIGIRLVRDWPD